MTSDNKQKRTVYFDAIKCLAIFMVCIYHFNGLDSDILNNHHFHTYAAYLFHTLLSMCVPLFFMVNGALLLNRTLDLEKHLKKTFSVFALVYVWAFILSLILMRINGDHYSVKEFASNVWNLKPDGKINHLWFLKTLVSIYLFFPLMKLAYDQMEKKAFYYLCCIIFFFSFGNTAITYGVNLASLFAGFPHQNPCWDSCNFFPLVNPFGNYFYSYFYFLLGAFLFVELENNRFRIQNAALTAIFIVAALLATVYGVIVSVNTGKVFDTVWHGYDSIMTLTMSGAVFIFCSRISCNNEKLAAAISFVGKNTLGIYVLHTIFGNALMPLFKHTAFAQNFLANILLCIVILFLSLMTTLFIKRIPFLSKLVSL